MDFGLRVGSSVVACSPSTGPTSEDRVTDVSRLIRTVLGVRCRRRSHRRVSKRSLGVDAKPRGSRLLKRMAAVSDIAIENNLTGIMEQMGIGYGGLSARTTVW